MHERVVHGSPSSPTETTTASKANVNCAPKSATRSKEGRDHAPSGEGGQGGKVGVENKEDGNKPASPLPDERDQAGAYMAETQKT